MLSTRKGGAAPFQLSHFEFSGPNLRRTRLSHLLIGNSELERVAELLGVPVPE